MMKRIFVFKKKAESTEETYIQHKSCYYYYFFLYINYSLHFIFTHFIHSFRGGGRGNPYNKGNFCAVDGE